MTLLIIIVLVALGVSGLCSILEASLLSASVVELSQRAEKGNKGAARLLELKQDHVEDSISAILTYNTIAHTVGAALSGAQAAVVFGDDWVGLFSGVLTLLILVFTEIIPKTVGTVHAGRLAGFSGRVISLMILPPMKWLLFITGALTRLIARDSKKTMTRGDVKAMVKIAARDGALPPDESTLLSNLLRFEDIQIQDIMTPRTVLAMVKKKDSVEKVLNEPDVKAFSRLPVYSESRDNIEGYILTRELLEASLEPEGKDRPVEDFVRPIQLIDDSTSVGTALKDLVRRNEQIAMVIDELGALSGLVSLEDLFETALGTEIIDELDQVVDLRQKALELRDRRLARMRERLQRVSKPI